MEAQFTHALGRAMHGTVLPNAFRGARGLHELMFGEYISSRSLVRPRLLLRRPRAGGNLNTDHPRDKRAQGSQSALLLAYSCHAGSPARPTRVSTPLDRWARMS
jgi:hypothetical protein